MILRGFRTVVANSPLRAKRVRRRRNKRFCVARTFMVVFAHLSQRERPWPPGHSFQECGEGEVGVSAERERLWYEFRRQLEYKMQWQGGWLMTVNPRNTSRTCPVCGHVSADNRTTQAKFACVSCGHQAHADVVGAINILARGMQNMRHGGKDMPPNACIESFMPSLGEGMGETTCTYDLVCPEGHAKESQGFPLRGNRDSSHGGDVSHAKLARVKHASPMKQEPTEVILQDE